MIRMRYLFFTILIAAGFLFNGELYMLYQDTFEEGYYQADFYIDAVDYDDSDEVEQDFEKMAKKYNVDFFVVDRKYKSSFEMVVTIYGTEKVKYELDQKDILTNYGNSIFFGNSTIRFLPFREVDDIGAFESFYFLDGETSIEKIRAFKSELIDQYGGGFPKLEGSSYNVMLNLELVWTTILGLIGLSTIYLNLYHRKENMIRIILGGDLNKIFLKNFCSDTLILTALFFIIPRMLSHLTNTYFKYSFVMTGFIGFLLLNLLLHLGVFKQNYKIDFSLTYSNKSFLVPSYVLKFTTTVLLCIILGSNFLMIKKGYDLYKLEDFFKEKSNYNYYRLFYKISNNPTKDIGDNTKINQNFYEQFQSRALQYVDLTENYDAPHPVILINKNSIEKIKMKWKSIKIATKDIEEDQVFLLLPSNLSKETEAYYWANEIAKSFFNEKSFGEIKSISYESGISLVGVHRFQEYSMTAYKDPIILFHNADFKVRKDGAGYDGYYYCDTMYQIEDYEWKTFLKENQLENQIAVKTGVYDVYQHSLNIAKRNIRMGSILSAFLILIELGLITFIIRTEYQHNAIEMAIKKMHGYTLWSRNRGILSLNMMSTFIGIVLSLFVNFFFKKGEGEALIVIGTLLLSLETAYILYKAASTEKLKITTILKGKKI